MEKYLDIPVNAWWCDGDIYTDELRAQTISSKRHVGYQQLYRKILNPDWKQDCQTPGTGVKFNTF